MIRLLVFGNELIEEDSLGVLVGRKIKDSNIKVIECKNPDDVVEFYDEKSYILDVAKGIDKVVLLNDIDKLIAPELNSLHDFDLGFFLKLLKGVKEIDKINIIAIPINGNIDDISEKVMKIINVDN